MSLSLDEELILSVLSVLYCIRQVVPHSTPLEKVAFASVWSTNLDACDRVISDILVVR